MRWPTWAASSLTEIRPSAIKRSISRREPKPACASTLCNLGASGCGGNTRFGKPGASGLSSTSSAPAMTSSKAKPSTGSSLIGTSLPRLVRASPSSLRAPRFGRARRSVGAPPSSLAGASGVLASVASATASATASAGAKVSAASATGSSALAARGSVSAATTAAFGLRTRLGGSSPVASALGVRGLRTLGAGASMPSAAGFAGVTSCTGSGGKFSWPSCVSLFIF